MNNAEEKLNKSNIRLANFLKKEDIQKIMLTAVGNSIASGYSMINRTEPLLMRNHTINEVMEQNNIELERHSFARAQNNADQHIYEWLINNNDEKQMCSYNIKDYTGLHKMATNNMSDEDIKKYYETNISNIGMQDIISSNNEKLANIIIYCGCTGSFLDLITRDGYKLDIFKGIKKDTDSLKAFLSYVQIKNRDYNKNMNTQVYVCGAPDFLGLKISNCINNKLKKIVQDYANTVYVNPVKSKFFYKSMDGNRRGLDIHYDEEEYLSFNNNIIESIIDNYRWASSLIKIDCELYHCNTCKEFNLRPDCIINNAEKVLTKECQKFSSKEEKNSFLDKCEKYLYTRWQSDYYYLGKKETKKIIKKIRQS